MTCKGCPASITRNARTGYCFACSMKRRGNKGRPTEGLKVEGEQAELSKITSDNPRTLAELVQVCDIDLDEWRIDRWVANKWEMANGELQSKPLYQIKVWLTRNTPVLDAKNRIAGLIADAKAHVPRAARRPERARGSSVLELSIPDLHLGKLAWTPETGYGAYDLKTAVRLYETAVDNLVSRTRGFTYSRVWLPVGNDFFHSDTKQGSTTEGTKLDTDSRYHKAFTEGRRLLVRTIETLRKIAPVDVIVVPGNHDVVSAFAVGEAIDCWFHNTRDVRVLNSANPRKYVEFGQTMVMFTHGHKGAHKNYPLLMATEEREMFGRTRFHEAHVGHLHQTRTLEIHGVRVRISPALCPPDAWHSENQFVGQLQGAEAFVWDKAEGLVATAHYTVREGKRAA